MVVVAFEAQVREKAVGVDRGPLLDVSTNLGVDGRALGVRDDLCENLAIALLYAKDGKEGPSGQRMEAA